MSKTSKSSYKYTNINESYKHLIKKKIVTSCCLEKKSENRHIRNTHSQNTQPPLTAKMYGGKGGQNIHE